MEEEKRPIQWMPLYMLDFTWNLTDDKFLTKNVCTLNINLMNLRKQIIKILFI